MEMTRMIIGDKEGGRKGKRGRLVGEMEGRKGVGDLSNFACKIWEIYFWKVNKKFQSIKKIRCAKEPSPFSFS